MGRIYCVTRYKKNVEELKRRVSILEVLWDNGEFYLLRLRRLTYIAILFY